jgi:hypothetical protein
MSGERPPGGDWEFATDRSPRVFVGRRPHSYASRLHGDNGTSSQLLSVLLDYHRTDSALAFRRDFDQAHDTRVLMTTDNRQLSEILVERDQDPIVSVSLSKDLFVTRIRFGLSSVYDIVSGGCQFDLRATRNAGIEQ